MESKLLFYGKENFFYLENSHSWVFLFAWLFLENEAHPCGGFSSRPSPSSLLWNYWGMWTFFICKNLWLWTPLTWNLFCKFSLGNWNFQPCFLSIGGNCYMEDCVYLSWITYAVWHGENNEYLSFLLFLNDFYKKKSELKLCSWLLIIVCYKAYNI